MNKRKLLVIVFGKTRSNKIITEQVAQHIQQLDDVELIDLFACLVAHIAEEIEKNPDAFTFLQTDMYT